MADSMDAAWDNVKQTIHLGDRVTGRVVRREHFGVFVDLSAGFLGLLACVEMQIPPKGTLGPDDYPQIGETVSAVVIQFIESDRQFRLSERVPEGWQPCWMQNES